MAKKNVLFCTMCGMPQSKDLTVVNIYEGLYLCDQCIKFINDKRDEAVKKVQEATKVDAPKLKQIPKPKEIHDFLNQYVIGQEDAKKYHFLVRVFATTLRWNEHYRAFEKFQQSLLHTFA